MSQQFVPPRVLTLRRENAQNPIEQFDYEQSTQPETAEILFTSQQVEEICREEIRGWLHDNAKHLFDLQTQLYFKQEQISKDGCRYLRINR